MKRTIYPVFFGILLIVLGLMVIAGWIFHLPRLTSIVPGYINMVFNTAFSFFLCGVVLVGLFKNTPLFQKKIPLICGSIILLIACLSLLQMLIGRAFVDELVIKIKTTDINPFPGRMAVNTSFCFVLTSIIFITLPYHYNKYLAALIQLFIFIIFFIGFISLLGYLLSLNFLYSWFRYSHMAIHTASGMIILGIGLAAAWSNLGFSRHFYKNREDRKIIIASILIFLLACYTVAFSTFVVITRDTQNLLKISLEQSLKNRIGIFQTEIDRAFENTALLLQTLNDELSDGDNLLNIEKTLNLNPAQFSGMILYDNSKKMLLKLGKYIESPELSVPINQPYTAKLLWDQNYFVQYLAPIKNDNKNLGYLAVQWPLKVANSLFSNYKGLGKTGEILICTGKNQSEAQCFPSRLSSKSFVIPYKIKNQTLPMYNALQGQSGVTVSIDYRGQSTISAYSPMQSLGLGIVNKIDIVELYQPIRLQLNRILLIVLFSVISCWIFILLIIRPLLRKVIDSEKAARKQQKLLQESERRFYSAFAHASIGMALVDLGGNLLKVNEALCKITGYSKKELMATSFQKITYSDDLEIDRHHFNDLTSGKIKWYKVEKRYFNKEGNIIWILLNSSLVRDIHNQPQYVIKQIQDITKQKEAEKQLVYLSQHDPLTGLSNRAALEIELKKIIDFSRRNQKMFAIFFMDLDKFKEVNDSYGHEVGDELLKYVADRLKNSIRTTDQVARLGGDEFIIILTDISSIDSVKILAEKIIDIFKEPVVIKGHILESTISIGISIYPTNGEDILVLLNKADQTLYLVKKSGRKGYRLYCSEDQ